MSPEGATDSGTVDSAMDSAIDSAADADAALLGPCNLSAPFGAPVLLQNVNDTMTEDAPHVTPDELTLYFSSNRAGGSGGTDLWMATRTTRNLPFGTPTPVPGINTTSTETAPTLSADQKTIFFDSNRNGTEQIWSGTRASTAQPFGSIALVAGINGSSGNGAPFLRADGLELWFHSDRTGGGGGLTDIWRASGSGVTFMTPVAVPELTSAVFQLAPYLTTDGLTIYWYSNRSDGGAKGAADIWTAQRASLTSAFTGMKPVLELNSSADDSMGSVSVDGCRIYFASFRPGIGGGDLYVAEKP